MKIDKPHGDSRLNTKTQQGPSSIVNLLMLALAYDTISNSRNSFNSCRLPVEFPEWSSGSR